MIMSEPILHLHHYDLESLAKSMKLASIDVIKTSNTDIESHWFRAKGPADLYYWKAKDKIVKHQISIYNQVVEWNELEGVKTGYVNDDIDAGRAEVICFDETINTTVIEQAINFLGSVREVDKEILEQLIKNYKFYNRWTPWLSWSGLVNSMQKSFKKWFRKKS